MNPFRNMRQSGETVVVQVKKTKAVRKILTPPKTAHRKLTDEEIRRAVEAVLARRRQAS